MARLRHDLGHPQAQAFPAQACPSGGGAVAYRAVRRNSPRRRLMLCQFRFRPLRADIVHPARERTPCAIDRAGADGSQFAGFHPSRPASCLASRAYFGVRSGVRRYARCVLSVYTPPLIESAAILFGGVGARVQFEHHAARRPTEKTRPAIRIGYFGLDVNAIGFEAVV